MADVGGVIDLSYLQSMCYSTKGFSINVLSVIQGRHFQSMCCQLFNQGIFNQRVVSYSTKGFSINVLSVIQPRDF